MNCRKKNPGENDNCCGRIVRGVHQSSGSVHSYDNGTQSDWTNGRMDSLKSSLLAQFSVDRRKHVGLGGKICVSFNFLSRLFVVLVVVVVVSGKSCFSSFLFNSRNDVFCVCSGVSSFLLPLENADNVEKGRRRWFMSYGTGPNMNIACADYVKKKWNASGNREGEEMKKENMLLI